MYKYSYYSEFDKHQYENILNGRRFEYGEFVKARYIKQEQPQYSGNVLIEALPPEKNNEDTFYYLRNKPTYSESERYYPDEYRVHAIFRLEDFLMPTSSNILVDKFLSLSIRKGYKNKKICTPEYYKMLKLAAQSLEDPSKLVAKCSSSSNSSNGFLVVGATGCGKTTGLNNSLAYYPQVIQHCLEDSTGSKHFFTQIPWIRIDCSYDGLVSGICRYFFAQLDELLGTNYLNEYGSKGTNIDKMIAAMSSLALKYAIGVLVVDEIQNIRNSKNGEHLFNFFVTLSNTVRVPIIYIGTYRATDTMLGKEYAKARKSEGIGTIEFPRLEQNTDPHWTQLISTLWQYQWVKKKTPLTTELENVMYNCSLGIVDRVIKIFQAVQLEAIITGEEEISSNLIKKVTAEKFTLTDNIIKAYRSGNRSEMYKYDDIDKVDLDLRSYLSRNTTQKELNDILGSEKYRNAINKEQKVDAIIVTLSKTMGYTEKEIKPIAIKVVNRLGFNEELNVLNREVLKELMKSELKLDEPDKKDKVKPKKAKKNKESIPESFAEENVKDVLDGIV